MNNRLSLSINSIDEITMITEAIKNGKIIELDAINKNSFKSYYLSQIKDQCKTKLSQLFELSEEDAFCLQKDLKSKEEAFFDNFDSIKVSQFVLQKSLPNNKKWDDVKSGYFYNGSYPSYYGKTCPSLDYYDNRRDPGGEYELKYGKFYYD